MKTAARGRPYVLARAAKAVAADNAGIVVVTPQGALDPTYTDASRAVFETNYYGTVRTSKAFVPVISGSGGGAIINVLSDATWFAPSFLFEGQLADGLLVQVPAG